MERVIKLEFDSKPDYNGLRRIFRELFIKEGYEYDGVFDWTGKEFE